MPEDRLEVLRSMLAQDEFNAFARYGLAMELVKTGDLEAAVSQFDFLVKHNPNYAAAYFHYGKTLAALNRTEEARTVMNKGVEITSKLGDQHAKSELLAALDILDI